MADRIQQRRDTKARWEQFNPVLLEGEVGYVLDDVNRYKIGDGVHAWNDLPYRGFDGTIVHDTGNSENAAMSQKGVTEKLTELGSEIGANIQYKYELSYKGVGLSKDGEITNPTGGWREFGITTPIVLKKGQTISVISNTYGYCAIAEYKDESLFYTPLFVVGDTPQIATYTATKTIQVICSGLMNDMKIILNGGGLKEELNRLKIELKNGVEYNYEVLFDKVGINKKGKVTQSTGGWVDFIISKPVTLKAGQTISTFSNTYDYCAIAEYKEESTFYTPLSVVINSPSLATYTAITDIQVVLSGLKSDLEVYITSNPLSNEIKNIKQELGITELCSFDWLYEKVGINKYGKVTQSTGSWRKFGITTPILLKKGQTIFTYSNTYGYCAIAKYNESDSFHTPLFVVEDTSQESRYTANEDIEVICSGLMTDLTIYIEYGGIKEKIAELKEQKSNIISVINKDAYQRNFDKTIMLTSACRLNKNSNGYKDFQFAIITDEHADFQSIKNVVSMGNGFETIDAIINCGDLVESKLGGEEYVIEQFDSIIENSIKPVYSIIGNHDVGNSNILGYLGGDYTYVHNKLIKPMYDKGLLNDNEYIPDKNYYYKNFDKYKIRMIVIDQYNSPLDVISDENWEVINYNPSLSLMIYGTTYSKGTELNFSNYNKSSFRLKKDLSVSIDKTPKLRIPTGDAIVMQEQAEWLLNTLINTPSDYNIILAMHTKFSADATPQNQFAFDANYVGGAWAGMTQNWLSYVINAYNNRKVLSLDIEALGNASYLNTDGIWYHIEKDFTNVKNKILFAIGGHVHADSIFKDDNIYQICPICASTNPIQTKGVGKDDIRRTTVDGICYDSITVVSSRKNDIALVKLGVNVTEYGIKRDYEVIPLILSRKL